MSKTCAPAKPAASKSVETAEQKPRKRLVKGNEAIAIGAMHGGCEAFFGYPITPQNEVPELLSGWLPREGRVFLQAESEVASINMVYGAAAAGHRVMTSSSSPGISLMMEGLSYCAGARLPCVLVNVMRGGPGLGNIAASQGDYFQAVKGGGHGDYRCIVLAPWSVQEMFDLPRIAFDLADRYRVPVIVLADAVLGSMLEPAEIPEKIPPLPRTNKPWATTGRGDRKTRNVVNSLFLQAQELSEHCENLQQTYREIQSREVRFDARMIDDAQHLVVAYGIAARIALSAVNTLREKGLRFGLLRPMTLFPFPSHAIESRLGKLKSVHVFELSSGQMVEDVRLAVNGKRPVQFFGRMGGLLPTPDELVKNLRQQISQ